MNRRSIDPKKGLFAVLGILLPLAFLCLICIGGESGEEYIKNGTAVKCRVVGVISRDGVTVEALCDTKRRVSVGDEFVGYVLPDKPMYVCHGIRGGGYTDTYLGGAVWSE